MERIPVQALPAVQAALDSLLDPVYVVDTGYNLVWVNLAYRNLFGYRPRHRRLCHEVAKLGICQQHDCLLQSCLRTSQQSRYVETSVGGALEGQASCNAVAVPVFDPATDRVVAAVGVLRDTSVEVNLHRKYAAMLEVERNRKVVLEQMVAERTRDLVQANETLNQANLDLARSRKEVADILQNIRQGILTVDENLQIGKEYSRFSEELFDRAALAGADVVELLLPEADGESARERNDLKEWFKLIFHSPTLDWSTAKELVRKEYVHRRPEGEQRELLVDVQAIREEQRVARMMLIIEDLTEKRALERSLSAKQREIDENIAYLAEVARLDPEMFGVFFEEALGIIESSGAALGQIRAGHPPGPLVDRMFREMHTLKGNAMSMGLVRVAAKAHWVEDAFSALRASGAALSEATVTETEGKVRDLGELLDRVKTMASKVLSQKGGLDNGAVRSGDRPLKVEIDQARLTAVVDWLESVQDEGLPRPMLDEIRARILALTRVPLSRLYHRFPKMVDDLAEQLGKNVNPVVLEGGELALEGQTFNKLANALVHLLRNSVDHGIEPPAQRLASGKVAQGTVKVLARQEGPDLVVEVSDDGRGIDAQKVLARARERGVIDAQATLSDEEAIQLIFAPGFSTAEKVTDVSGRGVGLDAVKAIVDELEGTLAIQNRLGEGTSFRIQFPAG
ncbi:MAG: Hpt domain-containing protein [Deltaproteobacteria bacterium]|nr:Hpt domain-containing protein [Deltaproteobacteria bacterium]